MPYDHLLSVGFVNERPDPTKHYEAFDAVVHGNDGSLLPVTDLLEEIAPTPSISRTMSRILSLTDLPAMVALATANMPPPSPSAPAA